MTCFTYISFFSSSGDPNETEVDSILLLTDDCYIVADYDSHLDKITRFEKVALTNITMIELGMYQQTKIFQGSAPAFFCLRLNYSVDGVDGYFHMFRSPNLRFFNNVAIVIKTQEELVGKCVCVYTKIIWALNVVVSKKVKNAMIEGVKRQPLNFGAVGPNPSRHGFLCSRCVCLS